ncbi:Transposase (plasmid) [Roseomonas mucosa]|nr:Transposase [Roseomonas mucosa]
MRALYPTPYAACRLWPCPAVTDTSDRLKGLEVRMAEGSGKRRFFPEAFKLEAVAAVRGGRSVSQVAAELGLPDRLVRSWLRWAPTGTAVGSGAPALAVPTPPAAPARRVGPSPAEQAAEIGRLRREVERLRMERDILKRAALIFGQATDRR